jgi:aspartate racemase
MKTIGIIGGLGPETTSEFYLEIVFECYKKNKEQRPPILIWNVPLKYKIEEDLLEKAEGEERYIPYLIEAAKKLEKAGADFLVIPCNSVHAFIKEVRNSVKIPVLSILEETAKFLKNKNISKVGILATPSTIKRRIYEIHLKNNNIKQITPDGFDQAKVGKMINNLVLNRHNNKDRKDLLKIVDKFKDKNVENVILACTDLQILIPEHSKIKIYDTMKILADATVDEILK